MIINTIKVTLMNAQSKIKVVHIDKQVIIQGETLRDTLNRLGFMDYAIVVWVHEELNLIL